MHSIAEFNFICTVSKMILGLERDVKVMEYRNTFQKGKMEHIWATQCELNILIFLWAFLE